MPSPKPNLSKQVTDFEQLDLKQEIRDRNLFFSMISHELRSPLQAINAAVDNERKHDRGQAHRDFIRVLDTATKRLAGLLEDMHILSAGEAGKIEMRPEMFDVAELVETVLSRYVKEASSKGVALFATHPAVPLFVAADPIRLDQLLGNLVHNAVKYTHAGSVRVTYEFQQAEQLVLSVADTGVGMPSEQTAELFKPYRRFGAIDKTHRGAGIGLVVVKTLVNHLGGTVRVDSRVNAGSTFTVAVSAASPEIEGVGKTDHAGKRILVVDDSAELLAALAATARSLGYQCDEAASAIVAANLMAARSYDAVLIDLDMPTKTGHELASETRRASAGKNRLSKLVAIGSNAVTKLGATTESLWPFSAYLVKPIGIAALQEAVEARA